MKKFIDFLERLERYNLYYTLDKTYKLMNILYIVPM